MAARGYSRNEIPEAALLPCRVCVYLEGSPVAPTSKSAVSRISKSAAVEIVEGHWLSGDLPIWKSAMQQVWKPALRASLRDAPRSAPRTCDRPVNAERARGKFTFAF